MKNFIKDHTLLATILGIALSIIAALTIICCVNRAAPWQLLCNHNYKCDNVMALAGDDWTITCTKCNRTIDKKYVEEHFTYDERKELANEVVGNMDWLDILKSLYCETEETTSAMDEAAVNDALNALFN